MDPLMEEKEMVTNLDTVLCEACPFYSNQICEYEVLSPDEIVEYVVKFVQEINGIVELNTTITRMLLSHCKWDKEVMVETFFDNADKLYREAHVINPASVNSVASQSDNKECEICYAELSPDMLAESACGHKFCTSCWSEYLKVKIMDEGVGNSIACAASDCDMVIDDERVIQLVGDEQAKLRYQHLITNSFVQHNKRLCWCPSRGCSYAVKADYVALKPICCYCKCGYEFCFGCKKEYHAPVPCDVLERFETHEQQGHFRFHELVMSGMRPQMAFGFDPKIKMCPNPCCKIQLQKIDGCHVVTCKSCVCIFCWECLKRYKSKAEVYQHKCEAIAKNSDEKPPEEMAEMTPNVPITAVLEQTNTFKDDAKNIDVEPPEEMAEVTPNASMTAMLEPTNTLKDDRKNVDVEPAKETTEVTANVPMTATSVPTNTLKDDSNNVDVEPAEEMAEVTPKAWTATKKTPLNDGEFAPMVANDLIRFRWRDRRNERIGARRNRSHSLYRKHNNAVDKLRSALKNFVANKKWLKECHEGWKSVVAEYELAMLEWVRSCRTLKNSRIFEIYTEETTEYRLLQNLVINLEEAVTKLSRSIGVINVNIHCLGTCDDIVTDVLPAYANCQRRRRALLDYVNEGFDNEWWTFKEMP